MTISLTDNSPRIAVDFGSVTLGQTHKSFTVSFEFFDAADLNVYINGTLKTLTTHYTVTGGNGSTGTISLSTAGTSVTDKVVITRDIALARTTDFPTSGPFDVTSLNLELDKFIAISADLKDQASRALQLTDFDVNANLTLPALDDRKGRVLAFNSTTGESEAGPSIGNVSSISAITADISTLADIEDGTDATDAIQTVAGISGNVTTVAGVAANVTTVAGISGNVTAVAGDEADIGTVATNIANVNTVAGIDGNVTTVAGIQANVTTVAGIQANVTTVASNDANVTAVAGNAVNINTVAGQTTNLQNVTNNLTAIQNAAQNASNASADAIAAAASASAAANSFDDFDDKYLGSKALAADANPTVDNDGNALVTGTLYFNQSANEMRVYDGGSWIAASSAGGASLLEYKYTATAGQVTFTGSDDASNILSYTVSNLIVILNGVILENGGDYTATNGSSIVLTTGATVNDELNIIAFKSFTVADMVSKTNGGTFGGNVDFGAGIDVTGNITVTGTVDGRDVAADGTKLDAIEASADVTDTANVTSAGALMTSGGTLTGALNFGTSKWSIELDAGDNDLNFKYNGTTVFKLASNGAVTSANDVTAFGSP